MNTKTSIRWGILGCGDVTEVKSGPGFQKAEGATLMAVMRRNGELAADYARRHGVPRWYDDAEALINDPEIDAVYIATPPGAHQPLALRCAAAGKPCYVEKPMALSHAQSLVMLQAFAHRQLPLFVAYYRRAMPRFLKIRSLVQGGAIGSVRAVHLLLQQPPMPEDVDHDNPPWRLDPTLAGGGRFVDMGAHQLDFLDYLFGPITEVHGVASHLAGHGKVEDTVSASFCFGNGIVGSGSWCFSASERVDRCELIGSAGRLVFSTFDDAPFTLHTAAGVEEFHIPNPPHVQQPLIQCVTEALLGHGSSPSTGESAARTDAVIDRILGR
ncbi:MAG: oxidoreductase [Candidatus Dactylopiibacterium carminicum]|uniref:Oxidoreductase n=1 Tax=Candidatus Dactylopiibacterium carminicum TaxID=857335 RepID=A0A272EWE8_9RHOO|nr:Gfo/Idh/MocA family oxidoreductase [Candidatus Dactylopiibacterium carminicum]KAF7600005.1 gfo/Idh/MocA family oxidoreductase [Candidatus Dactylopiibacterium carminicum]PAS94429.1 MAG: oxidoreductase [Candidatus Dactylopiibacterium carminicum]PAS96408.1 MAG: oxidoreductase [Candidatus Dactylopiibacterium carminicum]PAT00009.1 MAG: oxidoreductase [Candidatus Dactylopiibacterium carminicum]